MRQERKRNADGDEPKDGPSPSVRALVAVLSHNERNAHDHGDHGQQETECDGKDVPVTTFSVHRNTLRVAEVDGKHGADQPQEDQHGTRNHRPSTSAIRHGLQSAATVAA